MKNSALAVSLVVALAIGVPAAVFAAARTSGSDSYTIDHQAYQWGKGSSETTSKQWRPVAFEGVAEGPTVAPHSLLAVSTGPLSATLSVDIKGAPVEFRLNDSGRVMRPGKAEFAPRPGDTSRSFTFVRGRMESAEDKCRHVQLYWRSPTGKKVVLERGNLVVTFGVAADDGSACID